MNISQGAFVRDILLQEIAKVGSLDSYMLLPSVEITNCSKFYLSKNVHMVEPHALAYEFLLYIHILVNWNLVPLCIL